MQFGDFKLHIIRECKFKLDGGAMFGVVPKSLWDKAYPADAQNRVAMACNLLFIDSPQGKVLIETGMGPRWSEKERERFELVSLVDHEQMLSSIGLKNEDVNAVIISHLHFDHAGAATVVKNGKLEANFKNARYYAQRGEFEFAQKANARARASYRADDFMPLYEEGRLVLLDGDSEILPGIKVHLSGGHTSHHQVVTFESGGKKGIYFADIIPTKAHLPPPWVMGYDHFPLASCDFKSEWLARAAAENWLVVFDHEIDLPWGHVSLNKSGKFDWQALDEESLSFLSPASV